MRISAPALAAGLLAGFVGFASSFAVVLQGLQAMGASPAQAASGLMALSIAMGLCGMLLSLWRRMPISIAWSTPGAALLAASAAPSGGFAEAVGAFLLTGALIVAAGLWKPLGRAVASIPPPLANAMLAGVLLGLCLAPVRAVAEAPAMGLAIFAAWALVGRLNRLLAVPAAVLAALVLIGATVALPPGLLAAAGPAPVWVWPAFSPSAMLGIALPLFLVTMASQNIPGMAVLNANGYRPAPGPLFTVTGAFTLLGAPLGGHAVNLAAITAALCASPEAEPDPARRWQAAVVAGAVYVGFGLLAGTATAFVDAAPPILIQAVAGLALLGAFGAALQGALAAPEGREAAVICFLVTASGLTVAGISGAFWGLLAGGGMLVLRRG
ncbi:benzoate/H(+) symporter BenE family transporter [Siccirubricoccus phaeus]|uniref:benzoate/H(+) symporter BenE family transporter n=1 Tax=Siccirubricoccus phaeus TaxID=2595053 RepID=UPI0011F0EA9B|nr:benzoate/H(+) symporter BenE family transporter [Siccirubricoccus phaeus]